jgi:Domain of unknown function (DUF4386)
MTVATNARLAGIAYLAYIAFGIGGMAIGTPAAGAVSGVMTSFCALLLGVTLYAITREQDRDLAMIAMLCRVLEAAPGQGEIFFAVGNAIFCWLLLKGRMIPAALAMIGLVSSAALSLLVLLQTGGLFGGRMVWSSPVTWFVWLPVLIFELTFAFYLLSKPASLASRSNAR